MFQFSISGFKTQQLNEKCNLFFSNTQSNLWEKIVPLLPCRDHLLAHNPFCLLTHSIRTLLAENRKIRQDLGVCEHSVGCKPGMKASLHVTLIYTFFSLTLSALFIRGVSSSKPFSFRPGLHKLYPFDFYLSANR